MGPLGYRPQILCFPSITMRILPPILKQSKDLMEVFISLVNGFYVELYKILQFQLVFGDGSGFTSL